MSQTAKPFETVLPDEYIESPIWEMAFDDSDLPGWDETWRKPVTGATNVPDKSTGLFIALRVKDSGTIANAIFYDKSIFPLTPDGSPDTDWIGEIFIWHDGRWKSPIQIPEEILPTPLVLEALPSIRNEKSAIFSMKNREDNCATRAK